MSKNIPSSVTAEEAVARMVNMDYIPEGFTLMEMLSAFTEEADVEYYNAKIDHLPEDQLDALRMRLDACKAREKFAQRLLEDLQQAAAKPELSGIELSQDSSSKRRYKLDSIKDWASDRYGIGIPEWSSLSQSDDPTKNLPSDVTWEQIEIRIRKDYKIAYSYTKGKWIEKLFNEIGLLDRKKQEPNYLALILINLSKGIKFPTSRQSSGKDKTAIARLRKSLMVLTGIESDPFNRFNESDGWKPRFKLKNDIGNADERAKKAAIEEELKELKDFADEDDAAGNWLKENE